MKARLLYSLAALVLLHATQATAQSPAALADTLVRWTRERGDLIWSASHPVTWPDFRAKPKSGGKTAAETGSGVTYTLQCRGDLLSFAVLATFSPARSWVRPDVPASRASQRILHHERTHFNISELFARQLRRDLAAAQGICPSHTDRAQKLFNRMKDKFDQLQDRYDSETGHGTKARPQADWNASISARIDSTAGWSAH